MKNSEHKPLNQVLKDQLGAGATPVPDFVWANIEKELFPKKKRRFFWWWFFGGVCILLTGVFCIAALSGEKHAAEKPSFSQHMVSGESASGTGNTRTGRQSAGLRPVQATNSKQNPKLNHGQTAYESSAGASTRFTHAKQKMTRKNRKSFRKDVSLPQSRKPAASKKPFSGHALSESPASDPKKEAVAVTGRSGSTSNAQNNTNPSKKGAAAKTDSLPASRPLTYAEALALVQRDFVTEKPTETTEKPGSRWYLGVYGGPSLYRTATFKDYFTSGQLSQRTFASSGFELGLQAQLKLGNRFRVYAGLTFNQKNTEFNYTLAIQEADYLAYLANGTRVPLSHIQDDGTNSCYFVKDVIARYRIQSAQFSVGTNFEFLRFGKFSATADVRLSANLHSTLKLNELRILDIPETNSEQFSFLQPGIGIGLHYQVSKRVSVGLVPQFSKQFYLKESFSKNMDELVIPVVVLFEL